ncbi:DUF3482 domain-containing protein [Ramlibacter sp. PS4R-6]|uniref:DUF3482 domain-containing protein n=1 Tax=Ramlibacter sp. PS4R-6 TaxID=3133438 RepID=UPI0030A16B0F
MTETQHRPMEEQDARRVVLVHAAETTDAQGALLAMDERDQADLRARQEALHRADGAALDAAAFMAMRARHVLATLAVRHPRLAALQEAPAWRAWVEWAVPLAALVTGVATDAIGNPHRVDLISLPLLGIVAWNLAMYLLFLGAALVPRREGRTSWLAGIGRWTMGQAGTDPAAQAAARFHIDWFRATRPLHAARIQRVLHLSAAAWALGVILSLLVRGLVVEYRVGWESTFLGPQQVHAVLSLLRLPALLVFPFDTFSVTDVAQMRFSLRGGAAFGAPWVWMYVALLVTVVVVPRLLLATFAAWREERLSRAVAVDVQPAYAERVESLMNAASVRVGLLAHRPEDRERFLLLVPDRESLPVLASSPAGDVMRLVDIAPEAPPAVPEPAQPWWARWWPFARTAPRDARATCDVVIHLAASGADVDAAAPVLAALARPAVTLAMAPEAGEGLRLADVQHPASGDRLLLDAMAQALPEDRRRAFGHVARAWEARTDERLRKSMAAIAQHAIFAARQVEELVAAPLSVRSLLPAERDAQAGAREAAMARIVARLDESARSLAAQLRRLHGVADDAAEAIEHRLEERFTVQQQVDAPQAGIAGAASGAAMGASIDLLAGGMTLGAAAALGALVGGGAAYIAAAWKNRSSPSGATLLQLSDEMLDALTEAALLRYVAVAHWARGWRSVDDAWRAEVVARVQAQRPLLAGFWNAARTQPEAQDKLVQPLAQELEAIGRAVIKNISPKSSLQQGTPTTRP